MSLKIMQFLFKSENPRDMIRTLRKFLILKSNTKRRSLLKSKRETTHKKALERIKDQTSQKLKYFKTLSTSKKKRKSIDKIHLSRKVLKEMITTRKNITRFSTMIK